MPSYSRHAYLAGLASGSDVDHRGTIFTETLLQSLLDAVRDPATGRPHIGPATFESATFESSADFGSATFEGNAWFESATFQDNAWFESATFQGLAQFGAATFQSDATFRSATFEGFAGFGRATFQSEAIFELSIFQGGATFGSATMQGDATFRSATFQGDADFRSATIKGYTQFGSVTFQDKAWFKSATFQDDAHFGSATFQSYAWFESATFQGLANFTSAAIKGYTHFESVTFQDDAWFESATFQGLAQFGSATFQADAWFRSATFEREVSLGPMACAGRVRFSGAVFGGPATLMISARSLECRRTRWSSTASLQLRYATVDFDHAVFEYPLTIAAQTDPFTRLDGQAVDEQVLAHAPDTGVRIATLRGVDAAHLVLADVDLTQCLFLGTVHLDQLRLEGACTFDTTRTAVQWRGWRPVRFTPRRTLAEEQHWRAGRPGAAAGWNTAVLGAGRVGPLQLAPVYRALRKAFEDGKHEPGAADFYYGEMEMRRHAEDIPRSERGLLTAYWALSGYGLRASRALYWLAAMVLVTIVLLMGFGLPQDTPKQQATGTVPAGGGKVTFEIGKDDPRNPTGGRITTKRFEKALSVTLNSVVFRSSGQDLTTAGSYIEMASRLVEPALLAFAVLAVRGRVKR